MVVVSGLLRENEAFEILRTVYWFLVNKLDLLLKYIEIEHAFQASKECLLLYCKLRFYLKKTRASGKISHLYHLL